LCGGTGEKPKEKCHQDSQYQGQELTPFVYASSSFSCDFIFYSRAIIELITSEDKQMMLVAQEGEDSFSD
jgi:hypothetical protein